MTVALLSIGTELSRGEIANTNGAWLGAELTALGFYVARMEVVPDDLEAVVKSVRSLAASCSLVIVTGGLGPTTDDLTAAALAKAAGVALVRDESALLAIRRRVEARGRVFNAGHEKQAFVPSGCELLVNAAGTAPGFVLQMEETAVFALPGVPPEMKRMFVEQVQPRIRPSSPLTSYQIRLRTYGRGESEIGQALEGIEGAHPGVTLGYRIHFPEVDVKVHARLASLTLAREAAERAATEVRARLGDVIYGSGDETFAEMVGRALRARGWRLAVAESCTGGLVSHLLTASPASDYFVGGAVTYANSAKTQLLGVFEDTLRGHGAVSAEVAAEMADGVRRTCETEVGIGVTGIAGPSGGTSEKPVGLAYWALSHPGETIVEERVFSGDRTDIQLAAAYAALDLLRRTALGLR